MILAALYDLALREKLIEDPDFEKIPVDFILVLSASGEPVALIPMQDERGKGQPLLVPFQSKRSGTKTAPFFLVDNSKYVLGLSDKPSERDALCLAAFRESIDAAALSTQDEGLLAITRFYARLEQNLDHLFKLRPKQEWSGNERLAFSWEGDSSGRVHDRPAVKQYWSQRRSESQQNGEAGYCMVTGQKCIPARLHGNIKGVPNSSSTGAALVSFNLAAFETHGLSQGANAPVSPVVADGYVKGLNWLLSPTDNRRHRFGLRLSDDSTIVVWTRQNAPELNFFLELLEGANAKDVLEKLDSPWKGIEPSDFDETQFYALTLAGNKARVVVRDWMASSLGSVKSNLRRYFEDLEIGNQNDRPFHLRRLVDALRPPGKEGQVPPDLAVRLFHCALKGNPFPRQLLTLALRRLRLPEENLYLRERCALIKASLIRLNKRSITVSLDETNLQSPYLLGRLFAVLERLQGTAQSDLNATIRDRYYGSASSTPALVFCRLLKLSMHHAAKAEEKGLWLERLKGKIMDGLPANKFPSVLNLEDQGLFAVGYYHQREAFFVKKETAKAE